MTKAVLPYFRERRAGHIIQITSIAGRVGPIGRAAAALLHIASLSDPPLRLLLGSDSYNAAEQAALQKLESDRKWKDLSSSTDYASGDLSAR